MILRRLALAFAGLTLAASASEPASAEPKPGDARGEPEDRPIFSRIRGLFDIELPDIDPPGTVRLTLHPHFGDLIHRDYLRIATGARWSVSSHLEFNAEAEAFGTHGLGGGGDGYGIGELRFGGKYVCREWLRPLYDTTAGFDVQIPTGRPPLELTDGHNHFSPYLVLRQRCLTNPRLTTFGSVGLDFITMSSVPGNFARNQLHDDSSSITLGAVYDLGQVKWTAEFRYSNTWIGGTDDHAVTINPSVLWYIPRRFTFHSRTQWIIGLGAHSTWGPDGHEIGTSTRARAEITLRQVIDRMKEKLPTGD